MTETQRQAPAPVEVVLCAFNGERYIRQQVESILRQSARPARLSIYDDGSTDRTTEVVEDIIRANDSGVEVVLHRNPRNVGYVQNFEQGIRNASQEFIALSDQDDLWEPDKLQVLLAAFDADTGLVFSDALLVDQHGASLDHTLWQAIRLTRERRAHFSHRTRARQLLLQQSFVTGAALMLRASLVPRLPPFPAAAPHDYWIAIVAAELSSIKPVDRALYQYRQHPHNVMGQGRWSLLQRVGKTFRTAQQRYAQELRTYEQIALALKPHPDLLLAHGEFQAKADFLRARREAVAAGLRGVPCLLRLLLAGHYRAFCRVSNAMFVLDACMVLARPLRGA